MTAVPADPTLDALLTAAILEPVDIGRIVQLAELVRKLTIERLLSAVLPHGGVGVSEDLARHCALEHAALLIFPADFDDAYRTLGLLGIRAGRSVPSVVVHGRLCERYGLDPGATEVRLAMTEPAVPGVPRLELFMMRRTQAVPAVLVERERRLELERHFALRVTTSNPEVITGIRETLLTYGGFVPDGGGFNPYEERESGGVGLLYFARADTGSAGGQDLPRLCRLEVKFTGDLSGLINGHLADGEKARALYRGLPH